MPYDATVHLETLRDFVLKLSTQYKDSIPNIQNEPLLESSIAFLKKLNPFSDDEMRQLYWCYVADEEEDLWKISFTGFRMFINRGGIDTSIDVEDQDELEEEYESEIDVINKSLGLGSLSSETQKLLGETLLPILYEVPTISKKAAILVHIWVHYHQLDLPKCT